MSVLLILSSSVLAQTEPAEEPETAETEEAQTEETGEPQAAESEEAETEEVAEADDYDPRTMRTEGLDDEAARSRFRVGQTFYQEGRFLEAAREFESAFELSGRASLLFNAYLAFRDAGSLPDSARTLEMYLNEAPEVEDHERPTHRLSAMQATLGDQREQEAAEQEDRRRLSEERDRHRQEAEAQRRRAEEAEGGLNPAGFAVGGVGVAMLLGSVVTGLIANGRVSDLEDNCPGDRCIAGYDLSGERSKADRVILTTDILLFGGIAVAAAGVVLLFVGRGGSEEEAPVEASASCGPRGCAASMTVAF